MKLSWFFSRHLSKFCLGLFLVLIISFGIPLTRSTSVFAQPNSNIERFNRAETLNLRRQIRQLDGNIRRLNQNNSRSRLNFSNPSFPPRETFGNPPIVNGQPVGRSDPLFERLATLLIELKEDVRNIDQRLVEIEQKVDLQK